jgi:hypothetical protein
MAPQQKNTSTPVRKSIADVKNKYSPSKKITNKANNVFLKAYKFGLLTLQLKKGFDGNQDAYFKDFIDILDENEDVAAQLGIIKVVFIRSSDKVNLAKTNSTGYNCKQIIGVAPVKKEDNEEYRKAWADKIINFLNNDVKWKYDNTFRFRADLTKTVEGKVIGSLDECLLDEDIGGFVGKYLYNSVSEIKNNLEIMKNIYGNEENLENGETSLLKFWENWETDE